MKNNHNNKNNNNGNNNNKNNKCTFYLLLTRFWPNLMEGFWKLELFPSSTQFMSSFGFEGIMVIILTILSPCIARYVRSSLHPLVEIFWQDLSNNLTSVLVSGMKQQQKQQHHHHQQRQQQIYLSCFWPNFG